jgi:dTDP-4-dehydrorhamnose reductase
MTMQKQEILGTGLSGLVGSKFVDLFSDTYDFVNMDLTNNVDILNESQVMEKVKISASSHIVHFAAFTDVTKAFEQTGDKDGVAYKVNVLGTRNMVRAAKEYGKHLIHISTAYVFDGEKTTPYVETDAVHPLEWYGQTKAWAEDEVTGSGVSHTILRIDRPYRLDEFPKLDLLHKVIEKLKTNSLLPQFSDTSWTPTSIEKFCDMLQFVLEKKPQGIFHATTEKIFSDFTFAQWVKETYHLEGDVREGSLTEYLATSNRPYQRNTALDTMKLQSVMK